MNESASLDILKGVGEKTKKVFSKAGIYNIGDLLHYYPRDYDTFEEIKEINNLKENEVSAVCVTLEKAVTVKRVKRLQLSTTVVRDSSGTLNVTWFNMPYLKTTLQRGYAMCCVAK